MDIYVCDANWLKTDAVDSFISCVWTDRYNSYGDVVLTIPATDATKAMITEGTFLQNSSSPSIMILETISIKDGILTATGTDLLYFLRNRMLRNTWQDAKDSWTLASSAGAGHVINLVMGFLANPGSYLTGGQVLPTALGANEIIPKLSLAPDVAGPSFSQSNSFGDLYTGIQNVAAADGLGISLAPISKTDGTGNILFKCYRGLDRTSSQSTNSIVIFDSSLDNFVDVEELRDISGYKNVAWVWPSDITAQSQLVVVYAPGASTLTGWKRRTMMVVADDISAADYTSTTLPPVLTQKGLDALANNNYVKMLDGQIVPQSMYTYGTDYNLGDIVELRGALGSASQKARIMEYIRSQDSAGETAYPTLSVVV